jgi:hypothetical protein
VACSVGCWPGPISPRRAIWGQSRSYSLTTTQRCGQLGSCPHEAFAPRYFLHGRKPKLPRFGYELLEDTKSAETENHLYVVSATDLLLVNSAKYPPYESIRTLFLLPSRSQRLSENNALVHCRCIDTTRISIDIAGRRPSMVPTIIRGFVDHTLTPLSLVHYHTRRLPKEAFKTRENNANTDTCYTGYRDLWIEGGLCYG